MTKIRAWLTPDAAPDKFVCRGLRLPAGLEWEAAIKGAILLLCDPENWEQYGSSSPEEAAYVWWETLESLQEWRPCVHIGQIFFFAGDLPPDGALLCDGAEILQSAYPDLYDVCGTVYGSASPGYFKLPDLSGRTALGAGSGAGLTPRSLGDTGGVETHQLTEGEMPSHDHGVHAHIPSLAQLGIGTAVSTPSIIGGSTDDAGGDNAHQNMQPFLALLPCIQAE